MRARRLPLLELWAPDGGPASRFAVYRFPFRIGRSADLELQLDSQRVSKAHAEILRVSGSYAIRDVGSRNGTYVNGKRVEGTAQLSDGDLVHVAGHDLRFLLPAPSDPARAKTSTLTVDGEPESGIKGVPAFLEALEGRGVHTVFQPLYEMKNRRRVGFEALTRTEGPGTPMSPTGLFEMAERHRRAATLSQVLRDVALRAAVSLPGPSLLFLNVHPAEMDDIPGQIEGVAMALPRTLTGVFEVNESAIADVAAMNELKRELRRCGMYLAYDDVGAGRSRLREIAETGPDFVKLDRSLVTGIDQSESRQQLLRGLLQATSDLGIRTVAEGIETQPELDCCVDLGCELAQGFFLGPPRIAGDLRG